MELTKNTRVEFIEKPHSYLLDGFMPLLGVTSLMKKHGLSADYGFIDEATLAHAATLGSMAHQTIENYVNGLPCVENSLIKSFAKLGLNIIATEYLVSDNQTVASAVDMVEGVDDTSVILWDIKRTSTVHRSALAWQLGIYKHLFEQANPHIKVVGCKCLPIKKGNKDDIEADTCGNPVDIKPVDAAEVCRLITCEKNGETYVPAKTDDGEMMKFSDGEEIAKVLDATEKLIEAQEALKAAEAQMAAFKDRAYDYMLKHNIDKIEYGGIALKLKRPYQSNKFDSAAFKKDHADLMDKYIKSSEVKGNVTITII